MTKITNFVLLFLLSFNIAHASKLMVTPTRLEFSGKKRTAEVRLINRGTETTTYRVSFKNLKMNQSGSYEEIKADEVKGDENFAHKFIRYSPRRVTLKPGEVQLVRFMVRKSKDIKEGEYRSHALFSEEASAEFGENIENNNVRKDGISVKLKPLFGISIPVIVKHGNVNGEAEIKTAEINSDKKGNKFISFKIDRSGNGSVYGDIVATLKPNNSKKEYEIGVLNGISVFYPYKSRDVDLKLNIKPNIDLKDATINIKYFKKESGATNYDPKSILSQKDIAVGLIKSQLNY